MDIFFFETQPIPEDSIVFEKIKEEKVFFSYFQIEEKYYLFVYGEKDIDIDFFYGSMDLIQELDRRQRKIRSFRGFFLYALEIIENGKNYKILSTNLEPFFWRKIKKIIRQNKKSILLEFLFQSSTETGQRESLQNQVNSLVEKVHSLEERIIDLETPNLDKEENRNVFSEATRRPEKASLRSEQ